MRNGIPICELFSDPRPFAYGDPHMHTAIPVCKIMHMGIQDLIYRMEIFPVCIRLVTEKSRYAHGGCVNPHMYTGINVHDVQKGISMIPKQDLLLDMTRPEHDANVMHAYADSNWATCVKTRRSFGGIVLRLAGGTIAYKCKFQPTVAGSSTKAEFMSAYDTGKMILFVRSVLWDLGIPQEAATVLSEDNDACTAMGNAQKPTARTRHMDIKYFSICEWVDRDLMLLERIDTKLNLSDHLTKGLTRALCWGLYCADSIIR